MRHHHIFQKIEPITFAIGRKLENETHGAFKSTENYEKLVQIFLRI